ncbi:isochorismatase family cysteine hydrolase [Neorhodopirellula pilleata]|uniref:Isochorismatase family protein YecD n=1 Tax=Neorhodopirellula pilleata TaxID=2714738 RepID=A0A5C6AFZ3_9BACT|nr:isochorismatase family cysteine hydrolase [Neorhodopirellula pilleata]TWT97123.1 Isochorismatase family protein YecD [Neorhodopirellula pilleata]
MIPETIGIITRWWLHRRFRPYRTYPARQTAVLLVDAQKGLVPDSSRLMSSLLDLVALARRSDFSVVYSKFDAAAEHTFETRAHRLLKEAVKPVDGRDGIPDKLSPGPDDLVLSARSTLSAFKGTDLHEQLQRRGIEHLIIAGPLARISIDSSVRDGVQLGYHVTLIQEAISEDVGEISEYARSTLSRYAQSILSFQQFKKLTRR